MNQAYKELVEREEYVQNQLISLFDQQKSILFMLKALVTIWLLASMVLWRSGPDYFAYTIQEMPHLTITLPLVVITILYLWQSRLGTRRDKFV